MTDGRPLDLEAARAQIGLIAKAVEEVDDLQTKMNEMRWNFELLSRDASLGEMGRETVTAERLHANYLHLARQRDVAIDILTTLTATSSPDDARSVYLRLLTAYNRVGALRELDRMIEAGFEKAVVEAKEQGLADTVARLARINEALNGLADAVESVPTPAIIAPEPPTKSLILGS